mmetsp:Transcript_16823/g.48333  ORF Transcript_16823/g.48333 Transcript_16823/m.48333 type:complete len:151 (+) Transcript_16823:141-593(+)
MSHDDATAASGDPFDGVDTASEITEQTGMVSEFTMEKEERAKVATGIEEIKEDDLVDGGGEAASVSPSVSTQQEKIKQKAQLMAGQAKAVSSRAIDSVKSYEQEHHLVDKVKDKVQQVTGFVAGKVKACTSPGVKTGEGEAAEEHEDVKE